MTSPIVDDYIKYLRAIIAAKTTDTRRKNAKRAVQALSIMTAKAANEATERVAADGLGRAEGYLFGQSL